MQDKIKFKNKTKSEKKKIREFSTKRGTISIILTRVVDLMEVTSLSSSPEILRFHILWTPPRCESQSHITNPRPCHFLRLIIWLLLIFPHN